MDLQVHVPPVAPGALAAGARTGATSAALRAAVVAARALQVPRGCLNAGLSLAALDRHAPLDRAGEEYLQTMARTHALSARALVRIRRLARTIADLEGSADVRHAHLAEAKQFRVDREA
jgi:magnesium chelatase family protein